MDIQLLFKILCTHTYGTWHSTHVEVKGQLSGVSSVPTLLRDRLRCFCCCPVPSGSLAMSLQWFSGLHLLPHCRNPGISCIASKFLFGFWKSASHWLACAASAFTYWTNPTIFNIFIQIFFSGFWGFSFT